MTDEQLICWRCGAEMVLETEDIPYRHKKLFRLYCAPCGYNEQDDEEFKSEILTNYRAAWCFRKIKQLEANVEVLDKQCTYDAGYEAAAKRYETKIKKLEAKIRKAEP